tara:strand:- start:2521 stop:2847 length:327 start_codon:yes stop_codon:yes gene_type:complete
MSMTETGWEQYSSLVLKQLESLSSGIDALRIELQDVKKELIEIKAKEDRVKELKEWKDKIDEISSPNQLKQHVQDLQDLKIFKTKAVTVFTVVQFVMATALAAASYFR